MQKNPSFFAFMTAVGVAFPLSNAWAYLDPGTGSIILQMLLGGFAGLAIVGKLYWSRMKVIVSRVLGRPTSDEAEKSQ
jgi:hypothetical protein